MHYYIITRFSILDNNFKGFKCTKELDNDSYKIMLFDEKRLEFKFKTFEYMTAKTISEQSYHDYTWLVYTSSFLPENYKMHLDNILSKNKNTFLIYVDSFKDFYDDMKLRIPNTVDENYATIRLDDDDGLCSNFLELINYYQDEKNTIISFPNGIRYTIQDNKILFGAHMKYKLSATGLCAIGMNIYLCGDHTLIDKKYNVIYDNFTDAYYVCCSIYCDTGRKFIT